MEENSAQLDVANMLLDFLYSCMHLLLLQNLFSKTKLVNTIQLLQEVCLSSELAKNVTARGP